MKNSSFKKDNQERPFTISIKSLKRESIMSKKEESLKVQKMTWNSKTISKLNFKKSKMWNKLRLIFRFQIFLRKKQHPLHCIWKIPFKLNKKWVNLANKTHKMIKSFIKHLQTYKILTLSKWQQFNKEKNSNFSINWRKKV